MRVIKIWSGSLLVGTFPVGGGWGGWWANVWSVTPFTPPVGEILQRRPPDYNNAASYAKIKDSIYVKNQLWSAVGANQTVTHINIRQEPVNNLQVDTREYKTYDQNETARTWKNTSTIAPFPSYNKNLRSVDDQSICNRFKTVGHTERVFRQNSYNQQHNTHSYNSYLSLRNTSNIRGSPLFNGEGVQTINKYTQDIIHSKTHKINTINMGSPVNQ